MHKFKIKVEFFVKLWVRAKGVAPACVRAWVQFAALPKYKQHKDFGS